MRYKCPICSQIFSIDLDLADHITINSAIFQKYLEWIKSRGINYIQLIIPRKGKLSKGDYEPLLDAIENECKCQN